jgi:hypothetical protein
MDGFMILGIIACIILLIIVIYDRRFRKFIVWSVAISGILVAAFYIASQLWMRSEQAALSKLSNSRLLPAHTVLQIREGEGLQAMPVHRRFINAAPVVYLGHHQAIRFVCGDNQEEMQDPEMTEGGTITCP